MNTATCHAQAREKVASLESRLAMAEDAAEKGNKARELAGAMEACIQEQDEKIAGLEKERGELVRYSAELLIALRVLSRDTLHVYDGDSPEFDLHIVCNTCGHVAPPTERIQHANTCAVQVIEDALDLPRPATLDAARDKKGAE